MNCRECEDLIVEALYGELDPEAQSRFDSHIESCNACSETYERLRSTLEVMDEREQPDPGQGYWDGYYNRLSARMERDESERRKRGWLGRLFPGLSGAPLNWAYRGVLAVVLILFGVVVGRVIIPERGANDDRLAAELGESASVTPLVERASAEACARQYIEDSQVLLLALVNFDPGGEEDAMSDWTAERNRSRELVNQAASLKNELTEPKQRRLRELVNELELIMLQIANLETAGDLEAVDLIRSSVEDKNVMLKINLERMRGDDVAEPAPGACDA
jgi:hypothetical protein